MDEQFGKVLSELQDVKQQLDQMQEKGLRQSALKTVRAVESKIGEARVQLKVLKACFVDGVNRTIKGFKEKGTLAVYQTIDFLGIKKGLQASECPYNTQYSHSPGGITDPEYSIRVGIQNYVDCVRQAGCTSPQDLDKLKLSLQGYNYGNGYIGWAIRNYGGYSEANALRFSQEQAAAHGWSGYGDPEYVPHVLRYYSGGNLFAGLFGSSQMVSVAMSQLGNEGGQKFWSWYGFSSREEWCACFVSWCADQCGLIANGTFPRFSLCSAGMSWFQENGKWQENLYQPAPGTIIFFDWNEDGNPDHVGIVEKCENGRVYTVEGNSRDAVRQREYFKGSNVILGYGIYN